MPYESKILSQETENRKNSFLKAETEDPISSVCVNTKTGDVGKHSWEAL